MTFIDKLKQSWSENNSLLCVGLDCDLSKFPEHILQAKRPLLEFNKAIIDATADLVCAFKPQIAFYSADSSESELEATIDYIHSHYPHVVVILDAKRADIGNTSAMYAKEVFERYKADAVTVNPYMGLDSIAPFIEYKDKGIFVLCRTSNAGARDLQDLEVDGKKLYQVVASLAANKWNYNGNLALVVGATYPKELQEIRSIVGDMPFLMPGIGAQGGEIRAAVENGVTKNGDGMIISSSRAILYADKGKGFAQAARKVAEQTRDEINQYRDAAKPESSRYLVS